MRVWPGRVDAGPSCRRRPADPTARRRRPDSIAWVVKMVAQKPGGPDHFDLLRPHKTAVAGQRRDSGNPSPSLRMRRAARTILRGVRRTAASRSAAKADLDWFGLRPKRSAAIAPLGCLGGHPARTTEGGRPAPHPLHSELSVNRRMSDKDSHRPSGRCIVRTV